MVRVSAPRPSGVASAFDWSVTISIRSPEGWDQPRAEDQALTVSLAGTALGKRGAMVIHTW